MYTVSPVIPGHEKEQIWWAKGWLGIKTAALPVNPGDGCDTIILRYRLTWRERLMIFLGQDIFVWLNTYRSPMDNSVRFPKLFAENPVVCGNGNVVPHRDWDAVIAHNLARGTIVDSTTADGRPTTRQEDYLDREFAKTVKEKIEERDALNFQEQP